METTEWRNIVHHLYQNGWNVVEKYIGFDASIDIDYIVLSKDETSIELVGNIWMKEKLDVQKKHSKF